MSNIKNYTALNKTVKSLMPKTNNFSKTTDFISKNSAEIGSVVGLMNGLVNNKKYDTNIETRVVTPAPFTYTNRLGYLKNRNSANLRNLLNNRTGIPINNTQAFAQTLKSDNEIALNEGERQDKNIEEFNNRNLQIENSNIQAINRNNVYDNMLKNEQIADKTAVFNSFLENLQTNETTRNKKAYDLKALEYMKKAAEAGRANFDGNEKQEAVFNTFNTPNSNRNIATSSPIVNPRSKKYGTFPLGLSSNTENTYMTQNAVPNYNTNKRLVDITLGRIPQEYKILNYGRNKMFGQ